MQVDTTRAIIELSGEERISFLQGILTQDMTLLREDRGLFAALLSPQGKILHDMFLLPYGETLLIDILATQKDALLKRLTMYKLRAKISLVDSAGLWHVAHRTRADHAAIGHLAHKKDALVMTDPRAAELGDRVYWQAGSMPDIKNTVSPAHYHRHRLRLGVPDSTDIDEDVAMDAGYDALNAISFTKGCYVGQEVTARMHYKNIARKGFYVVESDRDLPPAGSSVMAQDQAIGTLRGSVEGCGLAMVKFDAAEAALTAGTPITVDKLPVTLTAPAWLHPKLAQFRAARENQ